MGPLAMNCSMDTRCSSTRSPRVVLAVLLLRRQLLGERDVVFLGVVSAGVEVQRSLMRC